MERCAKYGVPGFEDNANDKFRIDSVKVPRTLHYKRTIA